MEIYVVQPGDSVDGIARQYGVNVEQLIYDNQLNYPYALAIGQALLIPDNNPEILPSGRTASSNGYAYPFISPWVLEQTLPYLSELSVFSYGFTGNGDLIPPMLPDEWMVQAAKNAGVLSVLTLTPLGADGRFSNSLISAVVQDKSAQSQLIDQLLLVMTEKGYGGLDIDFEYILAADRDAFSAFVRACVQALHPYGLQVSVALAPKTRADQPGLLYQGKDYRALGETADHVLLMTYEWGYTYGPPMAVAPLNKVRQVVEYGITEIPSEKIDLGIPNYGYDWPLPYISGQTSARTIGNVEAVQIAIHYGAPIQFDELAQSPYFRYYDEGGMEHEVWFEDVRSLNRKYDLLQEFNLRGIGVWQLMRLFRASWILWEERFR